MKNLLRFLLFLGLSTFFLLQAQQVAAQSKDNDVLVMEVRPEGIKGALYNGMLIFWPDKEVEFIELKAASKADEVIANKELIFKKINELADLGWNLEIVDNSLSTSAIGQSGWISYYFKRAAPK